MKKLWNAPGLERLDFSSTANGWNQPTGRDSIYSQGYNHGDGDPFPPVNPPDPES